MTGAAAGRAIALAVLALAVGRPHSAQAEDGAMVSAAAPRGVTVRLETSSGDVEVVRNSEQKVVVEVDDGDASSVRLVPRDRNVLEVQFDGSTNLASGQVRVRLPAGGGIDVQTQSGDIHVRELGGAAHVRSLSGDISVTGAVGADVRTVSGDTSIEGTGAMRIKTVSGDMDLRLSGAATTVELESTSGDVRWSGSCGAGCRLSASTVSGDLSLALDGKSSFRFTFQSYSGELADGLGLQVTRSADRRRGADLEGRYAKGEGSVDCRTFSGDARLIKR
jgi:DUF4097 and DUF4098 domain-containing protein YvlB